MSVTGQNSDGQKITDYRVAAKSNEDYYRLQLNSIKYELNYDYQLFPLNLIDRCLTS